MAEALIVRLLSPASPDAPQAQWLVADAAGAARAPVQSGRLADASALAQGRRVIVLVPGADVLLAEPVLPVKSGAKLAQVVPFALEEQLAADIETLHFAVGKRISGAGTPVAVVSHERMQSWRAALSEAGLNAEALYPETSALPETPNGATVLIDSGRIYLRRPDTPGAVLEAEPLMDALQLALASDEETREHVTIYVSEDDYERDRDMLEGLREATASLQIRLLPNGPTPLMAAQVLQHAPVNLLQGPYAAKSKLRVSFAPWRQAAMLAVIFFAAHFGLKTWQYFHYQRLEAQLDQQITQVYRQAMPGAPTPAPAAARKQMEQRLAQLRGAGPQGGVMAALATVSDALAQAPGASVEYLSYRNNTTDLRVLAPSVDSLDRMRQTAQQHGVTAELQSANPRDSKFEGRLQLKGPGA